MRHKIASGTLMALAALSLMACGQNAADTKSDNQSRSDTASSRVQSSADAQPAAQNAAFSPYVDAQGNISRPTDFLTGENWTHLGSWGVVNPNGEGNGIHNVYTTYDVVKAYRETGKFPDGAVLVKEVKGAHAADLTTGRAHWGSDNAVWFVSIKDSTDRFPNNPLWGEGWGWALFEAGNPAKQVAKDYKADCLGCHVPAKDTDWMYVQAYPVLTE